MTVKSAAGRQTAKIATFMNEICHVNALCDLILNRFERRLARIASDTIDWLELQDRISTLPKPGSLLVETFRKGVSSMRLRVIGRNLGRTFDQQTT